MGTARQITIDTPRTARAAFLLKEYQNLMQDRTALTKLIGGMGMRLGASRMGHWQTLLDTEEWQSLAMDILESHYDPAYDRSVGKHARDNIVTIAQEDCSPVNLRKTATEIMSCKPLFRI